MLFRSATLNKIFGNVIGTDYTGSKKFGNGVDGIQILDASNNNWIGKAGAGNSIKSNALTGVLIGRSVRNAVSANSIDDNGELGIDLADEFTGITPNDDLDTDVGANTLQNFPDLVFADGTFPLRVVGTLFSTPDETFTIEIFIAGSVDSTKNGEGKIYVGSALAGTDSTGVATFRLSFAVPIPSGSFITATATDFNGNTSEFSKCIPVQAPDVHTDIGVTVAANADTLKKGDTLAYDISIYNNGPDSATQVIVIDSLSKHLTFIADSVSKGDALFANGILTVTVDVLAPGEKVRIVMIATVDSTGSIVNKAYASGVQFDYNLSNNNGSHTAAVTAVLAVRSDDGLVPQSYQLLQNYPNPFNPSTTIRFGVPVTSVVKLSVYDVLGREIARLADGIYEPGFVNLIWTAHVASGVYYYRTEMNSLNDPSQRFVKTKSMTFIK